MANIPLQSISFPGLSDKYTTPTVDATLTQTGAAADAKKTGDEIGAIKNDFMQFPNGNYPQMGVGYANQLVSGLKKEDSTPYNFRRIPYDATLEEVEKIVGGTIVNNQMVLNADFNGINYWRANSGEITANNHELTYKATIIGTNYFDNNIAQFGFSVPTNHVIFLAVDTYAPYNNGFYMSVRTNSVGQSGVGISNVTPTPNVWSHFAKVAKTVSTITDISFYWSMNTVYAVGDEVKLRNPIVCDVTQMFGTAIADYVYSLETATAGAGVAWLKKNFPAQFDAGYQAYDAGTLKSIEGLSEHRTVGFNQWNEVWEVGSIDPNTGADKVADNTIRSKNYIQVIPDGTYYIRANNMLAFFYDADKKLIAYRYKTNTTEIIPSNCHFIRFNMDIAYGTTYKNDICINLSDPAKNGTYEPYEAHSYALDSDVVLRGIPKLDSNNKLYYDGDEYLPDGTVNRRYGIVDLGTLNWTYINIEDHKRFVAPFSSKPASKNLICAKYQDVGYSAVFNNTAEGISIHTDGDQIAVYDTAYTDAADFKTAMSGVYLLYEKATAETETADPYQTPQIIAPDGTEEYIYTDGSFELPVGHSSDYPVDVSGQLDDILDTPSANGTYTLKATVTDGAVTYSWVADA